MIKCEKHIFFNVDRIVLGKDEDYYKKIIDYKKRYQSEKEAIEELWHYRCMRNGQGKLAHQYLLVELLNPHNHSIVFLDDFFMCQKEYVPINSAIFKVFCDLDYDISIFYNSELRFICCGDRNLIFDEVCKEVNEIINKINWQKGLKEMCANGATGEQIAEYQKVLSLRGIFYDSDAIKKILKQRS